MDEPPPHRRDVEPARSFDLVADAYDRGRPSYPREAVAWMVNRENARVLELGAGTGKLTDELTALGHQVVATDPSRAMLGRLRNRAVRRSRVASSAEQIPLAPRSVDVVVAGQAFHWFDVDRALPEVCRVLRPGGHLAVAWNTRDERIPWVKRLGGIIGRADHLDDPTPAIDGTGMFEVVETSTFRFWQPMTQDSLRDMVASRSNVAMMSGLERERVLRKVDELYEGYGRGADGMLLPYVTSTYRAVVLPWAVPEEPAPAQTADHPDDLDTDSLLIDFR